MEICAFPANNFGSQEPGSNLQIKKFCEKKNVTFKLFSKISVAGKDQHPLYAFLTDKKKHPETGGKIRWNFDKFLIAHDGTPIGRYSPREDPKGKKMVGDIDKAIAAAAKAKAKADAKKKKKKS